MLVFRMWCLERKLLLIRTYIHTQSRLSHLAIALTTRPSNHPPDSPILEIHREFPSRALLRSLDTIPPLSLTSLLTSWSSYHVLPLTVFQQKKSAYHHQHRTHAVHLDDFRQTDDPSLMNCEDRTTRGDFILSV